MEEVALRVVKTLKLSAIGLQHLVVGLDKPCEQNEIVKRIMIEAFEFEWPVEVPVSDELSRGLRFLRGHDAKYQIGGS